MKINLDLQFNCDQTLPVMPVKVGTGSALALELYGIPSVLAGGTVTGVSVALVNANAEPLSAVCTKVGEVWMTMFAASGFANYGYVSKGFKVSATVKRSDGSTANVTVGGDLEIVSASANAVPGTPSNTYQVAGGDVYKKTQVIGGVQHYIKEQMAYDPAIGWGAEWVGDYVKTNEGQFIPFVEG